MGRINDFQIDDVVRAALNRILNEYGKTAKIAAETGISKGQLSKYKSGATRTMPAEYFEKLLPYLNPYLPVGYGEDDSAGADLPEPNQGRARKQNFKQQIFNGVINVYGVPNEKIIAAVNSVDLTEQQRNELILKIFS